MRAFIATLYEDIPDMRDLDRILSREPGLRLIGEDRRHVTILFYSEIGEGDTGKICRFLESYRRRSFSAKTSGVSGFPSPRRARVIVLQIDSKDLDDIHRDMVRICPEGFDRKPFRGHITLARSRKGPVNVERYTSMGKNLSIKFRRISLIRSVLGPNGPEYSEICGVQLM